MINRFNFSEEEFKGKSISELSDNPNSDGMSSTDLKAYFDMIPKTMIALGKINTVLTALSNSTKGAEGANELGASYLGTELTIQQSLNLIGTNLLDVYKKAETNAIVGENTNTLVQDVSIDLTTGIFTITKKDGTVATYDTAIEKVPATFELVEEEDKVYLKITNVDGTISKTEVTSLIDVYKFISTDTIKANGTNELSFSIRENSIKMSHLSLDAISTLDGLVSSASLSAQSAKQSEVNSKQSENNSSSSEFKSRKSENNAKISEINSSVSEENSKTSEINSKTSEEECKKIFRYLDGPLIITKTLKTGSKTLDFIDEKINNDSIFLFLTTIYGVNPKDVVLTNGKITLEFDAQKEDIGVKVVIK